MFNKIIQMDIWYSLPVRYGYLILKHTCSLVNDLKKIILYVLHVNIYFYR